MAVAVHGRRVADAQGRNRKLCYDFDSFTFFAWVLLAPCYLFSTRKWKALLKLAWFLAMYLAGVASYFISGAFFSG